MQKEKMAIFSLCIDEGLLLGAIHFIGVKWFEEWSRGLLIHSIWYHSHLPHFSIISLSDL